jgi:hypothetical protein
MVNVGIPTKPLNGIANLVTQDDDVMLNTQIADTLEFLLAKNLTDGVVPVLPISLDRHYHDRYQKRGTGHTGY